ncbi:MAG: hypothetical protein H6656_21175 [Ardenticatenaceae bacterium]|nr:hypothetical protein [Ardenticatenaceae bacterium]
MRKRPYPPKSLPVPVVNAIADRFDIIAPTLLLYVQQQLEQMFGPDLVLGGGLRVYTTLDPHLPAAGRMRGLRFRSTGSRRDWPWPARRRAKRLRRPCLLAAAGCR